MKTKANASVGMKPRWTGPPIKAVVKQDPEKPVEVEILAESIVRISAAMQKLTKSGINRRGIVALLQDSTHLGKATIENVLDSLDQLAKKYTR